MLKLFEKIFQKEYINPYINKPLSLTVIFVVIYKCSIVREWLLYFIFLGVGLKKLWEKYKVSHTINT